MNRRTTRASVLFAWALGCSPTLELGADAMAETGSPSTGDAPEPTASSTGRDGEPELPSACEAPPGGLSCLACAQAGCCDEIDFCSGQEGCDCFRSCLWEGRSPEECEAACEPSSGMAAIMVCLAMRCAGQCGGPPEE